MSRSRSGLLARSLVATVESLLDVREAFLRLQAVVLTARHCERDADTRLDVDAFAQDGELPGVDEQSVVLDEDVLVEDA